MKRKRKIQQVKEHNKNAPNQREDRESTVKKIKIQNNDNKDDPKTGKQNGVTNK